MSDPNAAQTVLVVDGDVITRTVICAYLRDCGYRVIEANSGEEALQALTQSEFAIDIVLADVQLPGSMSGFDLSRRVRGNPQGTRIVLAGAVERIAQAAGDLCEEGPDLAKPYDPQLVVDHIKRLKGG